MVPTLKLGRMNLLQNGFINGYIDDANKVLHYEDSIFLLFKPSNLDVFKIFLDDEYENTKKILDDYDYEDGYVVVVYKLPEEFKKDYELIKQGKYSKTSKKFQDQFPEKVEFLKTSETSLQHLIFNKDEKLRAYWEDKIGPSIFENEDMEVWTGFDLDNETLNINEFKELEHDNK